MTFENNKMELKAQTSCKSVYVLTVVGLYR